MHETYIEYRKKLYTSLIGKITGMKNFYSSSFLRKNEKEAALIVLDSLENLRQEMQVVRHKDFDKEKTNENAELEFNVTFNPFTKTANIVTKIGRKLINIEKIITDFDYWCSFKVEEREYDIHFHYDTYFSVSIYRYFDGEPQNYDKHCKVRLVVVLKEPKL